jgi:hypothetical protein
MSGPTDQGARQAANLTGAWVGSYFLHDRAHPIRAELVQEGERLTGSMKDGETDRSASLFEVAAESGMAPGEDEQITERLRAILPDAPTEPIQYVWHLPQHSVLAGWVRGATVYFVKTYRGIHYGGYQIGNVIVGHQTEDHAVQYRGKLSPGRDEIEGTWWIDESGEPVGRRSGGSFVLQRQA